MTNHWIDIKNADVILIMGSNAAENHPVSFSWVDEARAAGATLIHVDPRFTRTSAQADIHAFLRSGSDIAFLGGMIKYILDRRLYHEDYVRLYTNGPFIVNAAFQMPGELDGLFSGYDPFSRVYDRSAWAFDTDEAGTVRTDETMTHPQCVLQLLKKHFSRYDLKTVAAVTGTPGESLERIYSIFAASGHPEKTATIMYAMGWTQHTVGTQNIRTMAIIQLLLGNIGLAASLYRLGVGLGPATNLSDATPWGLWITFDVMSGVALAAGGFTITGLVYILNWKTYAPITRAATLTAFLGYLLVMVGLVLDIGKPWSFWHAWIFWQPHSVMFEIVICMTLYSLVLFLEFLPYLLERIKALTGLQNILTSKAVFLPLVIAGIVLSYGHQSSLGGLFLLTPHKLPALWSSSQIHHFFFLSAVCAGLAMVSLESILSSRFFNRGFESSILTGLGRGTAWVLLVYCAIRLFDLWSRGQMQALFDGSPSSRLFYLEFGLLGLLPMTLLFFRRIRGSLPWLALCQSLVLLGVILYRFDVVFLAQSGGRGVYVPSWIEIAVTVGLISAGILLYRLSVTYLPVFATASENP